MEGITNFYNKVTEGFTDKSSEPQGDDVRVGDETRPINMKVVFIMKCWQKDTK